MDLNKQINFEHLLFFDRQCRSCKKIKNLMDDFYLTRRDRGSFASAYSYECKDCTIKRVSKSKKKKEHTLKWEYPDW